MKRPFERITVYVEYRCTGEFGPLVCEFCGGPEPCIKQDCIDAARAMEESKK